MPDLLSIVAGVFQLVDAVVKTRDYVKGFLDAPKDQQDFLKEMNGLRPLLEGLQERLQWNQSVGMVNGIQQFEEPLVCLKTIMEKLTSKLGATADAAKANDRLAWPLWGKKEVREGLDTMERFKTLLATWLAIDIWDALQKQRDNHSLVVRSLESAASKQEESHLVAHGAILQSIEDTAAERKQDHSNTITSLDRLVVQHQQDRALLQLIASAARRQGTYQNDAQRDAFLEWWSPINFATRQQDILSTQQPGTGEWFLRSDGFKAWTLSIGGRLWCPGMPGAGKTVLASTVVHHLRKTLMLPENIGVAVIYLNHKEIGTQSPANLVASIWRQLVFGSTISTEAQELYRKHHEPRTRPTLEDFHRVLCTTVADYCKVFLVVDAVDEYPEERRTILLKKLSELGPNVNLLLTSRPHVNISAVFAGTQTLEIRATAEDVRRYVDAQITDSSHLSRHVEARPELRQEIELLSIERSRGMFLLAKLHITSIKTKHTVKAVRDALKRMPTDLDNTYNEVMERINQQSEDDKTLARTTLAWVSNAKRLLSVSELRVALAVEPGTSELDPDNLLDMNVVLSVCAGLVVIDPADNVVRLVHYTAQDYLDRTQEIHFPTAQTDITLICITYLSFKIFVDDPDPVTIPRMYSLQRTHPLLNYAAYYGLIHANGQAEASISELLKLFLAGDASRWVYIWVVHRAFITLGIQWATSPLWIAAFFNLREMAHCVISARENADHRDLALQAAIANGHQEMIRLLVQNGADVNAQGKSVGSGLQVASYLGNQKAVAFLISKGADVHAYGWRYGTPLQAAATRGHDAIIRILLENGANVNSEGGIYGTALHASVSRGHTQSVRLLLQANADVSTWSTGNTPLHVASANGNMKVVQLLLERGADINAQNHKRETAIITASSGGHGQLVLLLLKQGADVDGGVGCVAPLRVAAERGHEETVQVLLRNGADVNAGAADDNSALQAAVMRGKNNVIRLLLNNGVDITLRNKDAKTVLHMASREGHADVVQLLLNNGADIHARDKYGETALHGASREGHGDVVQLLLENGADVHARIEYDRTPLHLVSSDGHKDIARLLLKNSADVNAGSIYGGTALHVASEEGNDNIVKLLLENGADVKLQRGKGITPLHMALDTWKETTTVVRLLLKNGADVNVREGKDNTPLHLASRNENPAVIRLLLENGADVNLRGENDVTPLHLASMNGNQAVVQLLLKNGADVNLRGKNDITPLHMASKSWADTSTVVRLLLENGADVNVREEYDNTPLHLASRNEKVTVIRLLLVNGADVDARNQWGQTALQLFPRYGQDKVVRLFRKWGQP